MANIITNLSDKKSAWNNERGKMNKKASRVIHQQGELQVTENTRGEIVVKDNTPANEQKEKKQWLCDNLGANKLSDNPVMILRDKMKIKE